MADRGLPPPRPGVQRLIVGGSPRSQRNGLTLGRNLDTNEPVTVTPEQLCSGCYVLGVQGVGKSSLLEQTVCQQLRLGESVIVFDPHGQLIDSIISRMPAGRIKDTYVLDLKDREYPFRLNVFACKDPHDEEERDRTRNQVMHAFEKVWPQTRSGVYFKKLLRHIIILLIEHPDLTLEDVPALLRTAPFRNRYVETLANKGSRDFWMLDYGRLSPGRQATESAPLLTRVDELLSEPVITSILCQPRSTVDIRKIIEAKQNLFIRLPINEDAYAHAASLVGTMLMAMVYAATFSFANVPEERRPGFTLVVDEFQNFATDEYARLFAQGRKFKAKQVLAHQYRDQLTEAAMEANKAATLTAQTKVIFSVTKADANTLADDFTPFEETRRARNLDRSPLDRMDRHPDHVVKDFAYYWGEPLKEATAARVRYSRPFTRRGRTPLPSEPIFPSMRFNEYGSVSFDPDYASKALACLNTLFYEAQRTGTIDPHLEAEAISAVQKLVTDRSFYSDDKRGPNMEPFKQKLREVIHRLQESPITIGTTTSTSKDVALKLQHLPRRHAYVRIGTKAYYMETLPLDPPVAPDELARRMAQLREQTRKTLCRHRSEDEPVAAAPSYQTDQDVEAPAQEDTREHRPTRRGTQTPQPRKQPRIQRSEPLDE